MTELSESQGSSYVAARIALVALRGTLRRGNLTEPLKYKLNALSSVQSAEGAAAVLADAQKPLDLQASVNGGVLIVSFRTLTEAAELAMHDWIRGGLDDRGGPLGFLRQRYGSEIQHLPILCVGGTERLVVSVSDFLLFHRDYRSSPRTGWGAAFVDSAYAQRDFGVQVEDAQGACAVVGFRPSRGNIGIPLPRWIARLFTGRQAS
jgi:hypothetical protein